MVKPQKPMESFMGGVKSLYGKTKDWAGKGIDELIKGTVGSELWLRKTTHDVSEKRLDKLGIKGKTHAERLAAYQRGEDILKNLPSKYLPQEQKEEENVIPVRLVGYTESAKQQLIEMETEARKERFSILGTPSNVTPATPLIR